MKIIPVRHINASQKEAEPGRFSIRTIEQVLNGKKLVHDLHKHDFYFVLALQKGAGVHEIDFVAHNAHDNAVFILRPGQVHRLELSADSCGFIMEFDLNFYQPKNSISDQRWKKASAKNYCPVEAGRFMKLHSWLSNIFNECTEKQDGYAAAIKANLDLFFIEYTRQSNNPKGISKSDNSYNQERFEELLHLMEGSVGTMKSVAEYAAALNLSAYQLNAITKSAVGKTVSDLINEQIVLEAKRYLLATANQIKDIADLLGFEDPSYFIRLFKKQTGHSPESFRKNFK